MLYNKCYDIFCIIDFVYIKDNLDRGPREDYHERG